MLRGFHVVFKGHNDPDGFHGENGDAEEFGKAMNRSEEGNRADRWKIPNEIVKRNAKPRRHKYVRNHRDWSEIFQIWYPAQ